MTLNTSLSINERVFLYNGSNNNVSPIKYNRHENLENWRALCDNKGLII